MAYYIGSAIGANIIMLIGCFFSLIIKSYSKLWSYIVLLLATGFTLYNEINNYIIYSDYGFADEANSYSFCILTTVILLVLCSLILSKESKVLTDDKAITENNNQSSEMGHTEIAYSINRDNNEISSKPYNKSSDIVNNTTRPVNLNREYKLVSQKVEESKSPILETKYCRFCGKQIKGDSIYCEYCGRKQ